MTDGSSTRVDGSSGQDDDSSPQHAVRIERVFDAPVDLVWQLWTDPLTFAAWYGPVGATVSVVTMDVRVGGTRLISMTVETPNGPMQMWFTGEYRQVVDCKCLVYTESISNEDGDIISPADLGMPTGHPTQTEIRVDFEDLAGQTKMVMTHTGISPDSPGATGWLSTLDKLSTYIASRTG